MNRFLLYGMTAAIVAAGISCSSFGPFSGTQNTDASSKTMSVAFSIATTDTFNRVARSARVLVTAPDMDSINQPMTITSSSVSATLRSVPIGRSRLFEVFVYDTGYNLCYYGSQYVDLFPQQKTWVYITLRRATTSEVVVIGTIVEDTMPDTTSLFITTPTPPRIIRSSFPIRDTLGFGFASGGATCSNGCRVYYLFHFWSVDSAQGRDTAWAVYSADSIGYSFVPRIGSYAVAAQACSAIDTVRSNWSEPLYFRATSLRQIR